MGFLGIDWENPGEDWGTFGDLTGTNLVEVPSRKGGGVSTGTFEEKRRNEEDRKRENESEKDRLDREFQEAKVGWSEEFTYPEFEPNAAFTRRKMAPLDLGSIQKQTRQKQAITGVAPSAEFIGGVAKPMLETAAKKEVALTELDMRRKREERAQEFKEYAFDKEMAYKAQTSDKEMAFNEYKLQQDLDLARSQLNQDIISKQAQTDAGDDISVICSELCKQGFLPENILRADEEHKRKHIDDETYYGYLNLAIPVVKLMKRSKIFTIIIKPVAIAFAYETASRMDKNIKGSLFGKFILNIGKPICRNYFKIRTKFISMRMTEVV